jgi:hypothetical protein
MVVDWAVRGVIVGEIAAACTSANKPADRSVAEELQPSERARVLNRLWRCVDQRRDAPDQLLVSRKRAPSSPWEGFAERSMPAKPLRRLRGQRNSLPEVCSRVSLSVVPTKPADGARGRRTTERYSRVGMGAVSS